MMTSHVQDKIIVHTGPSAIGKTDIALSLVKELDGYIISADSRQVYKELSIGTAKPSKQEILAGKMELVDHISIHQNYSAGTFMQEALELLEARANKTGPAILCGGTGLYIKAVCEGLDEIPKVPDTIVNELNEELESRGIERLQKELLEKDSSYYHNISIDNPRRVIRALSVIRQTGQPFSSFLQKNKANRAFRPIYLVLDMDRVQLYNRINKRVIQMIDRGLVDEVEQLVQFQSIQALQTVGYTEIFRYLDGKYSLDEASSEIQKNSRRYAKRQMTWNRNQLDAKYFHPTELSAILAYLNEELA